MAQPLAAPRWFFALSSRQEVLDLFERSPLTSDQKKKLRDSAHWQVVTNGFYVSPPPEVVLEMSRPARERIYSALAEHPLNSAQSHPFRFRSDGFEEWFAGTCLGAEPLRVVRKLIYSQGGSLCFCDGAVVQRLFSTNDFSCLVKALYGERTFLMRLRITPETDLDALIRYWGPGGRALVLRPLLASMAQVPGGASVNISYLLPGFARVRLYTYANPAADPTAVNQNCFWTAMNFFNEKPDNRFLDLGHVQQVLHSDYAPNVGPPRFGDLIVLRDASGALVHMCVYLADEVVFTKNGRDYLDPWVLVKLPDMIASYQDKPPVQVAFFRSKKL